MRNYVTSNNRQFDTYTEDYRAPYTPTVTAIGPPGYPINALMFRTSPFNDAQGSNTFAAMKWRIAEVTDETNPSYDPGKPKKYEIEAAWESQEAVDFNDTVIIPAGLVKAGRTYRIRCRMKDNTGRWSHWSSPVQFVTGEPLSANILNHLRITEIMYNPPDPPPGDSTDSDEFEFVELKNTGDETLDLTYVSFVDGITFDFNDSSVTNLAPGDFALVVRNQTAFESRYGVDLSHRIAGEYSGRLANGGENIRLQDFWNGTVAVLQYNDGRGWPLAADGAGHSLVPLDSALPGEPDGSLHYGGNWRSSTYFGGSPGQDDPEHVTTIVLNEIMAHTDYSNPLYPEHDSNDWIELYNTTESSINLQNWYLSDDVGDLEKWAIPAVEIAGYGRITFDEITGFHSLIGSGFGLNKAGEEAVLSYLPGTSEDRIVDSVRFKGQENGVSLGRYPDGGAYWFHMTPSRNVANAGPISDIVVDELMYHPLGPADEYIELYNPTAGPVDLENAEGAWRLDGAVDYTFPMGTSIPAGGRLIVVDFDPHTEIMRLALFMAAYNLGPLTAGIDIVGPWSGSLSNSSERLALERPQPPDQPGDSICWVIVDEVIYGDLWPWPEGTDGTGAALQRIYADQHHSGNDPGNWQADEPSPGAASP
jgi:hypothetical protein